MSSQRSILVVIGTRPEAVKLSPQARESAPRPDESDQMKRVAPPRAESPLQHVPALMDPPPGVKAPANP